MHRKTAGIKTMLIVVGVVGAAAATSLSGASAKTDKPAVVPPDAAMVWNANAVSAVRASSPTKFQVDGIIYMSYVQAAVYDAVTKIAGRYEPYHAFTDGRTGRLSSGGDRGRGTHDARPLPAGPAGERRCQVHRVPRDLTAVSLTGRRGRGGSERPDRLPQR
jgi:hypothetical protein